jgi:hypothetical protein
MPNPSSYVLPRDTQGQLRSNNFRPELPLASVPGISYPRTTVCLERGGKSWMSSPPPSMGILLVSAHWPVLRCGWRRTAKGGWTVMLGRKWRITYCHSYNPQDFSLWPHSSYCETEQHLYSLHRTAEMDWTVDTVSNLPKDSIPETFT